MALGSLFEELPQVSAGQLAAFGLGAVTMALLGGALLALRAQSSVTRTAANKVAAQEAASAAAPVVDGEALMRERDTAQDSVRELTAELRAARDAAQAREGILTADLAAMTEARDNAQRQLALQMLLHYVMPTVMEHYYVGQLAAQIGRDVAQQMGLAPVEVAHVAPPVAVVAEGAHEGAEADTDGARPSTTTRRM